MNQNPSVIFGKLKMLVYYYVLGLSPIKSLAKIYKDPMTFIMNVKEAGSKQILGFVFGRMAISLTSGRPIVMLNNIYLKCYDRDLVHKILSEIGKNIGSRLKAEAIILPIYHENSAQTVASYQEKTVEVIPLSGLNNVFGQVRSFDHDDFSHLPHAVNRPFKCKVNYKKLSGHQIS